MMSLQTASARRRWFALLADGVVITAGACMVGMALALGMHSLGLAPLGEPDTAASPVMFILAAISWLLQVSGIFVGPAIVWKLHQRRFSASAIFGAAAGFPLTAAALAIFVALSAAVDWAAAPFTTTEYAGPIALASLLVGALLVATAWLAIDAIADLAASKREHVGLDVARLVSVAGLAYAGWLFYAAVAGGGDLEGLDMLLAAAFAGGAMVVSADFVERFLAERHARSERASHA